jgi:hypothetical protein
VPLPTPERRRHAPSGQLGGIADNLINFAAFPRRPGHRTAEHGEKNDRPRTRRSAIDQQLVSSDFPQRSPGSDHVEPDPTSEEAEIVRGFLALQARTAADENRSLQRGTHAKGVCGRAVFDVLDVAANRDPVLAKRLAMGIFAAPGSYSATVRFANSGANINADWEPDVRSLSFAVELPPQGRVPGSSQVARQDYALQSAPTLPFNDVHAFVVYANVAGAPNEAIAVGSLPFRDQLVFAQTKMAVLQQQRQPVRPYQNLRYWSNVPFRHGPQDVVKYSASPDPGNPARTLQRRNPNALRDEFIRHLNEDVTMSSFEFGIQFLDTGSMTYQGKRRDAAFWIENASIEWPEEQAPFHTVARLTVLPRSALSAEASEAMYIDVTRNSTPDSAPVGGVNRARWYAETASRRARQSTA